MAEAEGMNFKVGVPSETQGLKKKMGKSGGIRYNNPTLEDVLIFIRRLPLIESDRITLEKIAKRIPHGALANFRENYSNYLSRGK